MIKSFVEKIPPNSKIAIFGAGFAGCGLKRYIDENRKDIKTVCFIDTFVQGEKENLPIISTSDLESYKNDFDLLICATRKMVHEIKVIFEYLDIPYLIITPYIEQYYRLEEKVKQQKEVCKIFSSQKDRDLYDLVWLNRLDTTNEIMRDYAKKTYNLSRSTFLRDYSKHYLEYINKNAIKTVYDAGFCNGVHSLLFKKNFKNLKKLYAFEPTYEKFKIDIYDKLITNANFCEIIELGLWNEETELCFAENPKDPCCSRIVNPDSKLKKNEILTKIKTTTIDLFRNRNLNEKIDFIKMDIEGAELPALKGGIETIKKDRPQLAISIYHSVEDFLEIPKFLHQELENYTFKIGHYSPTKVETVLYAIPNELLV